MKIEAIQLSTTLLGDLEKHLGLQLGLREIAMSRLGQHVVLTGPNGAGKTRLLRLLLTCSQNLRRDYWQVLSRRASWNANKEHYAAQLDKLRKTIQETGDSNSLTPLEGMNIDRVQQAMSEAEVQLNTIDLTLSAFTGVQTKANTDFNVVSYQVRTTALESAEQIAPAEMRLRHQLMLDPGAENASRLATSYVKQVLRTAFNAFHQDLAQSVDSAIHISDGKSLTGLLVDLLGQASQPRYEPDDLVSFFGQRNYEQSLSDGQKVLLQLGCALHAQGTALNEAIIFLDEPENHLHPAALVEVIDRLDGLLVDGQLWIATHSIPLIAHLSAKDPKCVWYMDGGKVEHAGRKPERVLEGLMGGRDGAQQLQDFTLLPGQLAINRFLSECLQPPAVVGADVKDPQTKAITGLISARRKLLGQGQKIRVLDFGAGKGRLLASLAVADEAGAGAPVLATREWLDYVALDSSTENAVDCRKEIEALYASDAAHRYFSNLGALETHFDAKSFDLVVMCNVLHELDPEQWLQLFGPDGKLTKLLKPDGGLLVVEDYQIPAGELAHRYGFLLLDEAELKQLFCWNEVDKTAGRVLRETSTEARYQNRLVMHWVAKPLLGNATAASRRAAIKGLKERSGAQISALRTSGKEGHRDGHLYALAAQSYANAALWLDANPD